MRRFGLVTKVVLLIFLLSGCNSNRFDIDVSDNRTELDLKRLDQDFFESGSTNYKELNDELLAKYGDFYALYIQRVLLLGRVKDPAIGYSIDRFLGDKYVMELYDEVKKNYASFNVQRNELSTAFSYYQHYFPNKVIPELVTTVSGFSANVIVTDSVLGIGLDMYLGKGHEYYNKAKIPVFKRRTMSKEHIQYDAMRGWLLSEFGEVKMKNDLLSNMIKYGKAMYMMDAIFPHTEDHMKIGYTKEQIEWCHENDYAIWSKILESDLLYSTNGNKIRRYIGEAPFTNGMPKESPGQIGFWVGWQIVRKYMEEYPETTMEELMKLDNAQSILHKSKYKPSN